MRKRVIVTTAVTTAAVITTATATTTDITPPKVHNITAERVQFPVSRSMDRPDFAKRHRTHVFAKAKTTVHRFVVRHAFARPAYVVPAPVNVPHVAPGGIAACIRRWESGGNYTAQNPSSTASGAYQFLDSTWQGLMRLPGRAMNYSPALQDKAFYMLWNGGAGAHNWVTAYHCGY